MRPYFLLLGLAACGPNAQLVQARTANNWAADTITIAVRGHEAAVKADAYRRAAGCVDNPCKQKAIDDALTAARPRTLALAALAKSQHVVASGLALLIQCQDRKDVACVARQTKKLATEIPALVEAVGKVAHQ